MKSYIVNKVLKEMLPASQSISSSHEKVIKKFNEKETITKEEKIFIENIYFNVKVGNIEAKNFINSEDKKLINLLEGDQKNLLMKNYYFYRSLDCGSRKPETPAQKRFVEVCLGILPPKNDHEKAYVNHIKNRTNLILEIFLAEHEEEQRLTNADSGISTLKHIGYKSHHFDQPNYNRIHTCQLCRGPIRNELWYVIGKTIFGKNLIMCAACYIEYGCDLEEGCGRKYESLTHKEIKNKDIDRYKL